MPARGRGLDASQIERRGFCTSSLLVNGRLAGEPKPKPLNFCEFLGEKFRLEDPPGYDSVLSSSHHPLVKGISDPHVIRFARHHRYPRSALALSSLRSRQAAPVR